MQPPKLREVPLAVSELGTRIGQWRAGRKKGAEMPEELWAAAARLARTFGINPIASALRLNYYALKERTEDVPPEPATPTTRPTFVELDTPPALFPSSCTIDAERAGEKLKIQVSGASPVDVLSLLHAFWSSRR